MLYLPPISSNLVCSGMLASSGKTLAAAPAIAFVSALFLLALFAIEAALPRGKTSPTVKTLPAKNWLRGSMVL